MNVKRTCAQRRVCIGTDKKGAHILNRRYAEESCYRPISTEVSPHDTPCLQMKAREFSWECRRHVADMSGRRHDTPCLQMKAWEDTTE